MDSGGLTSAEAAARLAADGPNLLPGASRGGTLAIVLEVVREPMFLLLAAAAGIYMLVGDLAESLVLAASIAVMVAITVTQERKAERALEALRDLSSPRALVLRDGERRRIAGAEVVRGDLLIISEGDRVAADARLSSAMDLTLDESLLTGESLPVRKQEGDAVHSGTLAVAGQGRAEVSATGAGTELGRIGVSLASLDRGKTSLELETARIVKLVAAFAIVLSVAMTAVHFALRGDWLASVLAGLTLAMAILPEEFPVVLVVFLALGAWRISRRGVLTRRMPAIEMLGAATVLCVDKTGTLTENRMTVVDSRPAVIDAAALACEIEPFDPMDRAILAAAGPQPLQLRGEWLLERDYPLTDDFLAMCHVWRSPEGEARVAIKGAPETVLALSGLDAAAVAAAMGEVSQASQKGLRLLAVAEADWQGPLPDDPSRYPFRWLGFVALADPLRPSVPEAVSLCRRAGIRVVMITGDFPGTAMKIAQQAGIEGEEAITGAQIAQMDDAALALAVRRVNVFARVRPDQKLRLVQAYRSAGEVVAMTGDGVNDAPALKAAHIGVAMGRRGSDVAREAASLVLLEDDFGSIVATVRLGRRIYENIRNAMGYIVAVHVPTAGMSFLPLAFGGPLFLYPVHVVFLEFVIDPACTLVYEAEQSEEGAMERPPRDPGRPLFDSRMLGISLGLGATMLAGVFAAYWWAFNAGRSEGETRAIGFVAIVLSNLALILVTRSRVHTLFETLRRPNPAAAWIAAGALGALAVSIYAPPVAGIFRFAPLSAGDLALAAAAGAGGALWYEAWKMMRAAR